MSSVAVIGAGISGLSVANFLKQRYEVTVYEKDSRPGGLIKCREVDGSLFHTCGGHVFNSKRRDVLDWFWQHFDRDREFVKADRHACVFMDSTPQEVPYPIENHMYCFDECVQKAFYRDLDEIDRVKGPAAQLSDYANFGDFLRWRFGETLYELYFRPYNEKVWRCDLTTVPMSWMEGKLPMPTTAEMRDNNARRVEEKNFVHSSFWYERENGSQLIANRLAEGLDIRYNKDIRALHYDGAKWHVDGHTYDKVVFCGNIKDMVKMVDGVDLQPFVADIDALGAHGTTAVFCQVDANPYSWIYLPSRQHESHRIICTGNFAAANNSRPAIPEGRISATVEFTDYVSKEQILDNLQRVPLHPTYIDHQYNRYTYPIQNAQTRRTIATMKQALEPAGFYFTGRFADWEYYNMDVAIGAAMDLCKPLVEESTNCCQ